MGCPNSQNSKSFIIFRVFCLSFIFHFFPLSGGGLGYQLSEWKLKCSITVPREEGDFDFRSISSFRQYFLSKIDLACFPSHLLCIFMSWLSWNGLHKVRHPILFIYPPSVWSSDNHLHISLNMTMHITTLISWISWNKPYFVLFASFFCFVFFCFVLFAVKCLVNLVSEYFWAPSNNKSSRNSADGLHQSFLRNFRNPIFEVSIFWRSQRYL